MSDLVVIQASEQRREQILDAEVDDVLRTLLDRYEAVTANPRSMGYLRFLLKHYGARAHPWTDCYKDNFKRFGPKTKGLCMAPTTPVSTERGLVEIADLREGDLVWSFDGDEFVLKPVLWSGKTRKDAQVMQLEVDGIEVLATPDHPFLRYRGEWSELRDLRAGEFLLGPLLRGVDSRGLSAACSAVTVPCTNSSDADFGVLGPQMPIGADGGFVSFSPACLDDFVGFNDFADLLLSTRRHPRFDDAHDSDSHMSVDTPIETLRASEAIAFFVGRDRTDSPNSEYVEQSLKRLDVVLRGDHSSAPTAEFASVLTCCSVPTEASFAFEETRGVGDVLGRKITKVSLYEKRMDVWDIEVADTHNFLVHGFIVAHNCGVLKDAIRQNPYWRHGAPKGPHPGHPDVGTPGVAIAEADKGAANPPWGPWMLPHEAAHGKLSADEQLVWATLLDIAEQCDTCRVLLGLDPAPSPSATFLSDIIELQVAA